MSLRKDKGTKLYPNGTIYNDMVLAQVLQRRKNQKEQDKLFGRNPYYDEPGYSEWWAAEQDRRHKSWLNRQKNKTYCDPCDRINIIISCKQAVEYCQGRDIEEIVTENKLFD